MMITHNLGYTRIGNNREIKKAIEGYWSGKINYNQLIQTSAEIKQKNWLLQKDLGIDLIFSNDFSFYDQVLDMTFIGPGVYDIHSLRVPSTNEMVYLLKKATVVIPKENIWVILIAD
jgi:methionine synthase II (cobalamin-independent)